MNSDYEAVTQTRVTQSEICWDEDLDILNLHNECQFACQKQLSVYLRGLWQLIWHLLFNKRNYKLYLEQSFGVCKVYTSENTGLTKRINPWQTEILNRQPEVDLKVFRKNGEEAFLHFHFCLKISNTSLIWLLICSSYILKTYIFYQNIMVQY